MQDYTQNPRAVALAASLRSWLANNPTWHVTTDETGWRLRQRTPQEVGKDLLGVLENMDVRLATVLGSPDGELIREVVGWVLPPGSTVVLFNLLVDAVLLAAQAQNKDDKVQAMSLAAVFVLGACFLSSLSKGLSSKRS